MVQKREKWSKTMSTLLRHFLYQLRLLAAPEPLALLALVAEPGVLAVVLELDRRGLKEKKEKKGRGIATR